MSAAHADAFYNEVLRSETVWGIRDADDFPAPKSGDHRAMPFWSADSRARRIVEQVEAYHAFEVVSLPLDAWRSRWLPGLAKDGLLVGLNWSGTSATGFDVKPADAEAGLVARCTAAPRKTVPLLGRPSTWCGSRRAAFAGSPRPVVTRLG